MSKADEKTPLLAGEEKRIADEEQPMSARLMKNAAKIHPTTFIGQFCNNGDLDPSFGEHVEIALRIVFALCIFMGFKLDPRPETRPWAGHDALLLVHPLTMTMLLFSIGKTAGEAIHNVYCGMFGTTIATVFIWIMFGFFPGGYYGEKCPDHVFWTGAVLGSLFVLATLWVNLQCNTKIFCLANWVWFWMDFLNADANTVNQGFSLNMKGTFMLAFARCAVGCGLAIVIALLPYPLWATNKARQIAKTVASDASRVWAQATKSYWEDAEGQVYEFDRLIHEINTLQSALGSLGDMTGQSWWECLGMGSTGRSMVYLDLLSATLIKNLDRLPCVLKSCAKNAGESSPEEIANHRRVAAVLLPAINPLVEKTGVLMKLCVEVSCDGEIDDNEKTMLKKEIMAVKDALNNLRLAVVNKRPNTGTSEKKFDTEYLDEYTFCFCVSHFARSTADFAQKILDMQDEPAVSASTVLAQNLSTKIKDVFDPSVLKDAETVNFVVRNGAGILAAFFLGFTGFPFHATKGHHLLAPLSAGASGVLSVMLTKFTGSAMQGTFNKMMNIILGIVCGMLMVGAFGQSLTMVLLVCAIWTGFTMFMYLHSTGNAGTFLLLCIFGVNAMLNKCPAEGCHWDERKIGAMNPIVECMFAVVVMMLIDLVMRPKAASAQAGEMLCSTWESLTSKVEHLFNVEEAKTHEKQANITAQIASCQALCAEACNEPTYWASPWKGALYSRVVNSIQTLRYSILCLNCSADTKGEHGNTKSDYFMKSCAVKEFAAIYLQLLERMKAMETFLPVFTYESQSRFPPLSDPKNLVNFMAEQDRIIAIFVDFVNKKENAWMLVESKEDEAASEGSVEGDPLCKLNVLMLCMQGLMDDMRELQHDLLRSA